MQSPILLVIGTRAEAVKLLPLYIALKKENINVLLCATFQHADLLQQVLDVFKVDPDFNLNVMIQNQDLFYLQKTIMDKIRDVYYQVKPKIVLVHGDTTTTMAAALAAFYMHIPIGHVEAGLRTGDMQSPFPEEMNRKLVGQIADIHFTPTAFATANLLSEGVSRDKIFCTGNTVVDALNWMIELIDSKKIDIEPNLVKLISQKKDENKRLILLTAHRRESFNGGLLNIFKSVKKFAQAYSDVFILYPMHPNPNVISAVKKSGLLEIDNILVTKSLIYKDLIYLLRNVDFVATDSGGIQEEAVSLGKHVIVLRDLTERCEGIWDGFEELVGTNENLILSSLEKCYHLEKLEINSSAIYGDGFACSRIVNILKEKFNL